MDQHGMTKSQSAAVQGLAILLMIYHHFFLDLKVFDERILWSNPQMVTQLAWFGKICVGLFAFVTGYGMCRVYEKRREKAGDAGFFLMMKTDYECSAKQIAKLLIRYWAVLALFLPVLFLGHRAEPDVSTILKHFFCLDYTYNGALWYAAQYVMMLLLLPVFDLMLAKIPQQGKQAQRCFYAVLGIVLIVWAIAAFVIPEFRQFSVTMIKGMRPAFFLAMFSGYLICAYSIYEKLDSLKLFHKKMPSILIGLLIVAGACIVRFFLTDSPAYATMDFLLVPFLVFGFRKITGEIPVLEKFFQGFGRISAYMWLTHLFVYSLTVDFLLQHTCSHVVFYVAEVLLDAALCLCIKKVESV